MVSFVCNQLKSRLCSSEGGTTTPRPHEYRYKWGAGGDFAREKKNPMRNERHVVHLFAIFLTGDLPKK